MRLAELCDMLSIAIFGGFVSQNAVIYRILVASPADCDAERKLIPEVVHYWNAVHSRQTGAILEPVSWETHSTPEMGDRPQGIINKQLGEISDLLVGTFWTRLGTSTGVAESGTAEEIEEFRKAGKPVLLYFSQQPAVLETVDQQQLQALVEYKRRLASEGLFSTYASLAELRNDLFRHLSSKMAKLHKGPAPAAQDLDSKRELRTFRNQYESFLRRFETEWSSERDSAPHSINEGQSIARFRLSDLVTLRAKIIEDNSDLSKTIDDALRRLRALQRWQLVMDGGRSFAHFWEEGTAIIESLKSVLPILAKLMAV